MVEPVSVADMTETDRYAEALRRINGMAAPPNYTDAADAPPKAPIDLGTATAERLTESRIGFDADFWTAIDEAEWLAEPFLARGRGHLIYAAAKTGKSLFTLYVAACLAMGRRVLDQPAGPPVRVLYADLEMTPSDVRERLTDMGFGPDDNMENLVYYSLPSLAPLDTAHGGAELVNLAIHHQADLVVIDTIGRVLNGEENSNDTAQDFAKFCGMPLKAAGITLLRVDHAGKDADKGTRGGSAKADDPDVIWHLIARDRGRFTLKATHRRISWIPETIDLAQSIEPLTYRSADSSWPAGTGAAADTLDRLQVPHNYGKAKARAILKEHDITIGNEVLMAAIRFRRSDLVELTERKITTTDGAK
jgi:hypothetical protein